MEEASSDMQEAMKVARQSLCQSLLLDNGSVSSSSSSGARLLLLVSSLMMMFAGVSCDMRSQSQPPATPARYLLLVSNEDRRTVSPAKTMYDEAGRSEEMSIF